jgi:hypothetical protein
VPAVVEVDHLSSASVLLQRGQHPTEPLQLAGQVALAQPDLGPLVPGLHRHPELGIDVDLRDGGAPIQPGVAPPLQQGQRPLQPRLHPVAPLLELLPLQASHHRQVQPVAGGGPLEDLAAGVDQVETGQVHQGHGLPLGDRHLERGRPGRPLDLDGGHPGVAAQGRRHGLGVREQQVVTGVDRGEAVERLGRQLDQAAEVDGADAQQLALHADLPGQPAGAAQGHHREQRGQHQGRDAPQLAARRSWIPLRRPPVPTPRHRRSPPGSRPDGDRFRALSPEGAACPSSDPPQVFDRPDPSAGAGARGATS